MRKQFIALSAAVAMLLPAAANGQADGVDAVADRPGIGTLVSALDGLEGEVHELQALGRIKPADVRIVGIGSALDGDEIATFQDAVARNRAEIDELRKFLTTADVAVIGNDTVPTTLRDYLSDVGVGVSDVVAVSVTGTTVTLFVDESTIGIEG